MTHGFDKCPKCGGKTGYYRVYIIREVTSFTWDGYREVTLSRPGGGLTAWCGDCGKQLHALRGAD